MNDAQPTAAAESRNLALAWADAVRRTSRPDVVVEAQHWLSLYQGDAAVELAVIAALVAEAERTPPDVPPPEGDPDHPALLAAAAAAELRGREGVGGEVRAYAALNHGHALRRLGPGADEAALEAYVAALAYDETRGWWHHAVAELHKWRGRWNDCLAAEQRARALLPGERVVALGAATAATALGFGEVAAEAYASVGLPKPAITAGGMPRVDGLGRRRVRVLAKPTGYGLRPLPDPCFELVWVEALSPCHGVLASPTFLEAPVDFGDMVLFDPARVATTEDGSSVHPLLERLRPADEIALRFVAVLDDAAQDAANLIQGVESAQLFLSPVIKSSDNQGDQGETAGDTETLEGDAATADARRLVYGKLVVCGSTSLESLRHRLEERARGGLRLAIPELYEKLGLTDWAGKQHRAWRSVERYAEQRGLC